MDIPQHAIGEWNEDGSVKTEASACLISGLPVLGQHAVQEPIRGTRYFVRILVENYHRYTDDIRQELADHYRRARGTETTADAEAPEQSADPSAEEQS